MTKKMKAAVLTKAKTIVYELRDVPSIKDNEVLVKIKHVGICGSDVHYYEHGRVGDFIVESPMVLGHECAGEVVETGSNVTSLKAGDLVALEPGIPCGNCEFCKGGKYNLCKDVVFMATPPYDGAFVEYVAYPQDMAFKLPNGMSTVEGALIEPLAVGLHAAKQAKAQLGQTAVILGSGCIGLVTLLALKSMGVAKVYVSDLVDIRLKKAKQLGAEETFNAKKVDVVSEIMALTQNKGVDIVIETAGSKIATLQTADMVKSGGTIVLVGLTPDPIIEFNIGKIMAKEARIVTVFRYRNLYQDAINAVAGALIPINDIVSHTFTFDEIQEGIEYNIHNKDIVVKAVIKM